jgi:hypothetical protein
MGGEKRGRREDPLRLTLFGTSPGGPGEEKERGIKKEKS